MNRVLDRPTFVPNYGITEDSVPEAIGFPQQLLVLCDVPNYLFAANNVSLPDPETESGVMSVDMLATFPYLDDLYAYQGLHDQFRTFHPVSKSLAEVKAIAKEKDRDGVCLWIDGQMVQFFFVK